MKRLQVYSEMLNTVDFIDKYQMMYLHNTFEYDRPLFYQFLSPSKWRLVCQIRIKLTSEHRPFVSFIDTSSYYREDVSKKSDFEHVCSILNLNGFI